MIRLTIAIVSYNVKFYVQQCIEAIQSSTLQDFEIIIVDNNSTDGSADFLEQKYGRSIKLIRNVVNHGFGTACNQALAQAAGTCTLFLNPDTIIQTQTLENVMAFVDQTKNVGLVGLRMINEEEHFLPESKRSIPTPKTSFFRLSGLYRIMAKSQTTNKYYAPHIAENEVGIVDVISGAFMLGKTKVLQEIGGFDEDFFMYGEDVDISYRMQKSGFDNYYVGTETIIHHKGKSTDKRSSTYIHQFYGAMSLFHKKHFKDSYSWFFNILIQLAIFSRKSISAIAIFARHAFLPLVELSLFVGGGFVLQQLWGNWYFGDSDYYGSDALISLVVFSVIWILFLSFGSSYRFFKRRSIAVIQLILGLIFILVMYSLLPIEWRSSRALIGLYFLWNVCIAISLRTLNKFINNQALVLGKRMAIVASPNLLDKAKAYEHAPNGIKRLLIPIAPSSAIKDDRYVGQFEDVLGICKEYELDTILISVEDFEVTEVKSCADSLRDIEIQTAIIDQHDIQKILFSKVRHQDLLESMQLDYTILYWENKMIKRVFDVLMSIVLLAFSVFHTRLKAAQLFEVITNKKSLIGYHKNDLSLHKLPILKSGLIPVTRKRGVLHEVHIDNLNYALHYSVYNDFKNLISFLL